jgi:glucose/mannose transport system permease protein
LPLKAPEAEPRIAPKGFNAALTGIIIAAIWQMSGYTMAMFLAGIRGVSEELREAARVDGCTEIGVYRRIVLPQLRPIVLSAMIVLGHISLKIFDLVFAMSGPDNARTVVPGLLVYTQGFRANNFSEASAIAVIMLFLVALVIIPYLWFSLRDNRGRA